MKHENGKTCSMCADCHGDVMLGRKVRALLASEEPPEGLEGAMDLYCTTEGQNAWNAWAWFREILGPVEAVPLPPPANIPEAGRGPLLGSLATGGATGGRDGE